jgi:prolycopene isomerase
MERGLVSNRDDLPAACDVAIIGAGVGGLTAGALLSRAGLEVCVLEAGVKPGGYLAGFSRGGFAFDTAVHWLNQCGPGGMVRRIFDRIGPGEIETPPLERIRRYRGEGFDYLLTWDPDEFQAALVSDFPADRRGIAAFFATARVLGDSFARFGINARDPLTKTTREKLRSLWRMTSAGWPFLRHAGVAAEPGLARFFSAPLRERLWRAESSLLACLMPVAWAYSGDYQRLPVGGSRRIPAWLAEACSNAGGRIACGCRAGSIAVDGDRARSVHYARGADGTDHGELRCRHVIAALDARIVYERLLPPGVASRRFRQRLEQARTYDSAVSVFLGLSRPASVLGLGEELVHITGSGLTRADHTSGHPERTEINVLAPSCCDPEAAPPGKGTLILHGAARLEQNDRWHTGPGLERGTDYRDFKRRYAAVLVERLERCLGRAIASCIESCEVATPVTYRRYSGGPDGAIMGLRPTRANLRAGLAKRATPLSNLHIGGQWAIQGGGLPGAVLGGANAAAVILHAERPAEFAALRDAMDGR